MRRWLFFLKVKVEDIWLNFWKLFKFFSKGIHLISWYHFALWWLVKCFLITETWVGWSLVKTSCFLDSWRHQEHKQHIHNRVNVVDLGKYLCLSDMIIHEDLILFIDTLNIHYLYDFIYIGADDKVQLQESQLSIN